MEFYILPFVCYLVNLAGGALLGPAQIGVVHTEHSGFLVPPHMHQAELRIQGPHFESNTGSLSHSSGQTAVIPLQGVVAADFHKEVGSNYPRGNIGGFVSSGDSGRLSVSAGAFATPGFHSGGISHSKTESINEKISSLPASRFAANTDVSSMPTSFGLLHDSVSTNEGVMNGGSGRVGAHQGSVASIGSGINSNFAVKTLQYPSQSHSSINAGSISCTSSEGLGCSSPPLKPDNANIRPGSANGVSDGIYHSMLHGSEENTGGIIEADIRLGLTGLKNDQLTGRISTGIDKTSAARGSAISPGSIRVSKPVGYTGSAYTKSSGSLGSLPSSNVGSNLASDIGRLITPGLITFEPNVFGSDGGSATGAFHGSTPSKNIGGHSIPSIGVIGGFPGSTSTSYSGSNSGSISKSYGGLSGATSSSNSGSKGGSLSGIIGIFPESIGTINSGSNAGSDSKINYGLSGSISSSYGGKNAGSGGFHGYPGSISSTNSESNEAGGVHTGINVSHESSEANSNAGGGYEEFSGY